MTESARFDTGGVEVAWRLAKHAWHHGYATEAAQAVMRRLGLTEVARFDHPRVPEAIHCGHT